MICPHCERDVDDRDDAIEVPEDDEGFTRGDIPLVLLALCVAINVLCGCVGLIHGGADTPRRKSAYVLHDSCDLSGKWNYVLPGFSVGCYTGRWMSE